MSLHDRNEGPIRRKRLYEEVERRIADDIQSGRLKAGDSIPSERDLMQRYGVGRPAVREALLSLRQKGLVRIGAGERTRVAKPTLEAIVAGVSGPVSMMLATTEGVRHLQHARRFFESALARHAASHVTERQLDALRARLEANRNAIGDSVTFERTDVAFHYELAHIGGNPIFSSLHQATIGWLFQQRTISMMQPGAMQAAFRYHRRVFEAIEAHDADAAERAMERHLGSVERYYWNTVALRAERNASSRHGSRRRMR